MTRGDESHNEPGEDEVDDLDEPHPVSSELRSMQRRGCGGTTPKAADLSAPDASASEAGDEEVDELVSVSSQLRSVQERVGEESGADVDDGDVEDSDD